jgi:hypothetical protein
MKLDRLLTLSQFIEGCENRVNEEMEESYRYIVKYDAFLKQPLTKDMFVNPLSKPWALTLYNIQPFECSADEMRQCREYKEAEKKVIFELDDELYLDEENYPGCVLLKKGCIPFGFLISDLAEATKGSVKTKNIEL